MPSADSPPPSTVALAPIAPPLIVNASPAMVRVLDLARRAANSDAKVLITGESGVGKDLVARFIHAHSNRASGPYIAINCAGVAETLLESELFGHLRGSFTDAHRDQTGKLQLADRGTLLLDELSEMSLRMQALLLRFLENGEIQPIGADAPLTRVNVRVIGATNRDPAELVENGRFREDLLYRLRVIHIHVPSLRERPGDVRALVAQMCAEAGRPAEFTSEALDALERYDWPGNVRELRNVVDQCLARHEGAKVGLSELPRALRTARPAAAPLAERRRQAADDLYDALASHRWKFFDHVVPLFEAHDITRRDLRCLVGRGLAATRGRYQSVARLFGVPARDYQRFLEFLVKHDCHLDGKFYRSGASPFSSREPRLPPEPAPDVSAPPVAPVRSAPRPRVPQARKATTSRTTPGRRRKP